MSIGKNAIKRVENNGYSKVKTEAPDMINSTVIGATDEQVMDMVEKQVAKSTTAKKPTATKTTTAKKPTAIKTTVKKVEKPVETVIEEKPAPVKEEPVKAEKAVKKPAKKVENKNGKIFACGEELPVYLL
ncbi:MAG: hypothetical protein IKJ14_00350 [Clostridia bacterium]|nr:hypothetical protein [Clostridia bacterium]